MNADYIRSFAEEHGVPMSIAKKLACAIAEQCALIANRFEPEGHFTSEQLSAVETLGAKIGHAIIERFPEP